MAQGEVVGKVESYLESVKNGRDLPFGNKEAIINRTEEYLTFSLYSGSDNAVLYVDGTGSSTDIGYHFDGQTHFSAAVDGVDGAEKEAEQVVAMTLDEILRVWKYEGKEKYLSSLEHSHEH
jgi:hypothetical protein